MLWLHYQLKTVMRCIICITCRGIFWNFTTERFFLEHHMHFPILSCSLLTHLHLVTFYASVNRISTGSDNGLTPYHRQAVISTNAGNQFRWNFNQYWYIFIQDNVSENVVRKLAANLFRGVNAVLRCNSWWPLVGLIACYLTTQSYNRTTQIPPNVHGANWFIDIWNFVIWTINGTLQSLPYWWLMVVYLWL